MKKVLFIDKLHPFLFNYLEKNGYHCVEGYDLQKEEAQAIISDFYGLVIRSRFKIDNDFLDNCDQLKFIARGGSGMENINLKFAQQKGISCINAPEGNRQAVAEHALAMLLSLFNHLCTADGEVRQNLWRRENNRGTELAGKTIGIIGYGNTGSAFAKLLAGFDVKVLAYDKYKTGFSHAHVTECSMDTIFEQTDVLSLHIPLTDDTYHLVNDAFLQRYQKPIYLINTSRGSCVNTQALMKGLSDGTLKGACLDVFEQEHTSFSTVERTPEFNELAASKKVILSPHTAGWTVESHLKIAQILFEKIKDLENI